MVPLPAGLAAFIFLAAQPPVAAAPGFPGLKAPVPGLHRAVPRVPPVGPAPAPEDAVADLSLLALPGTAVLLGGVVAALGLGLPPRRVAATFAGTVARVTPSRWRSASWSARRSSPATRGWIPCSGSA